MSTTTSALNTTSPVQFPVEPADPPISLHAVKIKKELPNDEIKEFAENTMNELLGWYGFDGVERSDESTRSARLLRTAVATTTASSNQLAHDHSSIYHNHTPYSSIEKSRNRGVSLLQHQQKQLEQMLKLNNNNPITKNNNKSPMRSNNDSNKGRKNSLNNNVDKNFTGCNDSANSDHDSRSSHEDNSKSPQIFSKLSEEKTDNQNCCWCRRVVPEHAPDFLTTSDGPRYCSEACFAQSRRASFKKAKTCDWCKHVRHAVSYVDFQDGASQLQFCSDKCLNQYKMQIFCKETQAHLDMNPHLRDHNLELSAGGADAGLITPDLWLRNCRSRSASPASTISVSPGPSSSRITMSLPHITSPNIGQNSAFTMTTSLSKPLISVAPVSKLMSRNNSLLINRHIPKHSRKKRSLRSCASPDNVLCSIKNSHHQGGAQKELANNASGLFSKMKMPLISGNGLNNIRSSSSPASVNNASAKPQATGFNQFPGSTIQNLQLGIPAISPLLDSTPPVHLQSANNFTLKGSNMQRGFLPTNANIFGGSSLQGIMNPRLPLVNNISSNDTVTPIGSSGLSSQFVSGGLPSIPQQQTGPLPLNSLQAPNNPLLASMPPVTVMVPYPIIIPLPIPIPVPLPVMDFIKAYIPPEQRQQEQNKKLNKKEESESLPEGTEESKDVSMDEPLDFTKTKNIQNCNVDDNCELNVKELIRNRNTESETYLEEKLPCPSDNTSNDNSSETSQLHLNSNGALLNCEDQSNSESNERPEDDKKHNTDNAISNDGHHQRLPKLKITRLQVKRTLIQQQQDTKELECSRPLRKRKRIIDCDFQKTSVKEICGVSEIITTELNKINSPKKDETVAVSASSDVQNPANEQ